MLNTDNPGVIVPAPIIYMLTFIFPLGMQILWPLNVWPIYARAYYCSEYILIATGTVFMIAAVVQFVQTGNSLIAVSAARSLQTTGVYAISRNPVYLGLLLMYIGLIPLYGNDWSVVFIPILIYLVDHLAIFPEERYLHRRFGTGYLRYFSKVRRWL